MAKKSFYDFEIKQGWLTTLEEILNKVPEEEQKEFLNFAKARYLENNWKNYLQEINAEFLAKTVEKAIQARNSARCERTAVGISLATFDGEIFTGSNRERYLRKITHAEEVAILNAETSGYHGTDFQFMVQIFNSSRDSSNTLPIEAYPACKDCESKLWDATHPDLIIINANESAQTYYATKLEDLNSGWKQGLIRIFPSPELKKLYPRLNNSSKPKLGQLSPYYNKWYDKKGNSLF